MLVGSGVRFGGQPMRTMGGITAGSVERARWGMSGALRNRDGAMDATSGAPYGYLHPRSWSMPRAPGAMVSRGTAGGTSAGTATLTEGRNATATGTATSSGTATGSLIASATASGSASSTATATAAGIASLSGTASASASATATMSAVASIGATATAVSASSATMTALAYMIAGPVAEELNPDTIAAAVWASGAAVSLAAAVDLVRAINDNRLEVDVTGQRLVLFADDGVTELREWPLATDGGEDVATASGVQTKRGVPA